MFFLYTPLEQFQILSFFSINLFCLDFSFTNMLYINIILIFLFYFIFIYCSSYDHSFYVVPNNWQFFLEMMYETIAQLLFDNINKKGEKYFPFIVVIFLFILFSNLIGLVPYSFTITSHIIVTFTLSLTIFILIIL